MLDLISSTNELHYETFRSIKLGDDEGENRGLNGGEDGSNEELTNEKGEVIKKPSVKSQDECTTQSSKKRKMH